MDGNMVKSIGILLIPWLLIACGPAAKRTVPPASAEAQPRFVGEEYRIRIGDTLEIKFFYNPELNDQVTVRPDGRISLQLVHDTEAEGLTLPELTSSLKEKYAKELARPELSLILRYFAGRKVFVDGEVNSPGAYDIAGSMTMRQFIAQAGGIKETARGNEIIVIRPSAAGGPVVMTANLDSINDGTDMVQDIKMVPNDIIYVPRSHIANANLWVRQYITNMLPIPVTPTASVP